MIMIIMSLCNTTFINHINHKKNHYFFFCSIFEIFFFCFSFIKLKYKKKIEIENRSDATTIIVSHLLTFLLKMCDRLGDRKDYR